MRNDNFGSDPVILPPASLPDWPSDGFRQLCLDHRDLVPPVHMEHIKHYFLHRQAVDQWSVGDLKAIEKGKDLVDAGRVQACSFILNENFFVTGIVHAQMKTKVGYSYKLKFSERGEVSNSDCECPAGKGPHATCKHVAAVCLMLEKFKTSGTLSTARSCTEELQTFHRPSKSHTGSPVKSHDLKIPSNRRLNLDDPRPERFRNMPGYQDQVNNLVTNFCYSSGLDLAVRYTWPKADLSLAVVDHDYLEKPFTEYWVDSANKVTNEESRSIEEQTRTQARSHRWHTEREWRITASMFGIITSITTRRNISKLCNLLLCPVNLSTAPVLHGRHYENLAIEKFQELSGLKVNACGLFVSPEYPFLGASPDGLVGSDAVVEIKCPYSGREMDILPGKQFPFLASVDGNIVLKPTHKYYDQIQGQIYLSKRTKCYFVVYTFEDCKYFEIMLDKEYCENSLLPKLQLFYSKYYRPHVAAHMSC